jgi:hypothetical protein
MSVQIQSIESAAINYNKWRVLEHSKPNELINQRMVRRLQVLLYGECKQIMYWFTLCCLSC